MRSMLKKLSVIFCLFLVFLGLCNAAQQKPPITGSIASPLYNLRDTYEVVADKYKHLSLINGAIAWETGYIEKILTVGVTRDKNDPTQITNGSYTAHLCNYLFTCYPSVGRGCPNVVAVKKIFEGLDQSIDDQTAKIVANIVAQALRQCDSYRQTLQIDESMEFENNNYDKACAQWLRFLDSCKRDMVVNDEPTLLDDELVKNLKNIINGAVADSIAKNDYKNYLPYTPEMILLAFVYRTLGYHKGYIKYFYEELNRLFNRAFLLHPNARSVVTKYQHLAYEKIMSVLWRRKSVGFDALPRDWENTRYDTVTPKEAKKKLEWLVDPDELEIFDVKGSGKKDCSLFLEDLVFYASQLSYVPKPNTPAWVTHELVAHQFKSKTEKDEELDDTKLRVSYLDTMGNAVRNFIRLLSYDYHRQMFSHKLLRERFPKMSNELINYLKDYPGPEDDDTLAAHSAWAKLLANQNYLYYRYGYDIEKIQHSDYHTWKNLIQEHEGKKKSVLQVADGDVSSFKNRQYKTFVDLYVKTAMSLPRENICLDSLASNILVAISRLLGIKNENGLKAICLKMPTKPEAVPQGGGFKFTQFVQGESTPIDKYALQDMHDSNLRLSGKFNRVMKSSWWSGKTTKLFEFNFVTTPRFGVFNMPDFSQWSQKPYLAKGAINYAKAPALSLLVTMLKPEKLAQGDEEKWLMHLPADLKWGNALLCGKEIAKKHAVGEEKEEEVEIKVEEKEELPPKVQSESEKLKNELESALATHRRSNMTTKDLELAGKAVGSEDQKIKVLGLELYAACVFEGVGKEDAQQAAINILNTSTDNDLVGGALGIVEAFNEKSKNQEAKKIKTILETVYQKSEVSTAIKQRIEKMNIINSVLTKKEITRRNDLLKIPKLFEQFLTQSAVVQQLFDLYEKYQDSSIIDKALEALEDEKKCSQAIALLGKLYRSKKITQEQQELIVKNAEELKNKNNKCAEQFLKSICHSDYSGTVKKNPRKIVIKKSSQKPRVEINEEPKEEIKISAQENVDELLENIGDNLQKISDIYESSEEDREKILSAGLKNMAKKSNAADLVIACYNSGSSTKEIRKKIIDAGLQNIENQNGVHVLLTCYQTDKSTSEEKALIIDGALEKKENTTAQDLLQALYESEGSGNQEKEKITKGAPGLFEQN